MAERVAIILAAGVSSRMNTKLPKVLHEVCGRPMLAYVLDACRKAGVEKTYVVVGYGGDNVKERFSSDQDLIWIEQAEQKGTAHAVLCCKEQLKDFSGQTLVLCGDGPLIRAETLQIIIGTHQAENPAATLGTVILDDPTGYGRIVRDAYGNIQGIVEHNDCTDEQLRVREVNPSYYFFNNKILFESLEKVQPNNVKNEYYLTDVISIILSDGLKISAVTAVRPEEAMGVNSREQLSVVGKIMQSRIQQNLLCNGVTIVDPENTWIDARATIGQDTLIEPFTYIHGDVKIGSDCRIGPMAYIGDGTVLEDGTIIKPGSVTGQVNGG
ncbi:MAG: bifunctional UDP-N-acetylglucosamine diphosphorylase/glucosamine-1-phosphate N-acetyltransferase GlmU [Planctomycetota bacterium]|jgi:bifunctional UDP-N-acetylglucosamine pyrophosphorylase/glucosamine-1-phosphate N-acetyltransferase